MTDSVSQGVKNAFATIKTDAEAVEAKVAAPILSTEESFARVNADIATLKTRMDDAVDHAKAIETYVYGKIGTAEADVKTIGVKATGLIAWIKGIFGGAR